jgi:hypothetical protein
MVYMASCSGPCSSMNSDNLDWFKISERGLISGTQMSGIWGTGEVMQLLSYTTTIPASLAPGEYLIRHELLALDVPNKRQFYVSSAQVKVTGSGTKTPSSEHTIKFPGVYSVTDPSINIDLYSATARTATTYKIPGLGTFLREF